MMTVLKKVAAILRVGRQAAESRYSNLQPENDLRSAYQGSFIEANNTLLDLCI